ncbi:MAG: hypothetical protein DCC88_11640, partial [Spirobacillus cienkowskii]
MEQKEFDEIIECISEPRLSSYKNESNIIIENYIEIIQKSQQIYPALHIIEVIFRNKVHVAVADILEEKNWLLEFKNGNPLLIETFSSLQKTTQTNEKKDLYDFFKDEVIKAYDNSLSTAKKNSRNIIEGDIIASLTFGFWTALMGKPFINILGNKGLYIKVFKELGVIPEKWTVKYHNFFHTLMVQDNQGQSAHEF